MPCWTSEKVISSFVYSIGSIGVSGDCSGVGIDIGVGFVLLSSLDKQFTSHLAYKVVLDVPASM